MHKIRATAQAVVASSSIPPCSASQSLPQFANHLPISQFEGQDSLHIHLQIYPAQLHIPNFQLFLEFIANWQIRAVSPMPISYSL